MSNVVKSFDCARCGKSFDCALPEMEMMPGKTATLILWAHPEPYKCPYCGQSHQMKIAGIQGMSIAVVPIKTENDSRLITPPQGLQLPKVN